MASDIFQKMTILALSGLFFVTNVIGQTTEDGPSCFLLNKAGDHVTKLNIDHIPDNLRLGDAIATLKVNTTKKHNVTLFMQSSQYVSLVGETLVVKKSVYNRQLELLFLECIPTFQQGSASSEIFEVTISFDNINTNAPNFVSDFNFVNLRELAFVGTTVIDLTATDPDIGNQFISYEVLPGPYSDHFYFPNSKEGILTLATPVDFEEVSQVALTVLAKDNHVFVEEQPFYQLNSTTSVTVNVIDEDDQNPVFVGAPYSATIAADAQKDFKLPVQPKISAYDPDLSINSTLRFSFSQNQIQDYNEYFTIKLETGEIYLAKSFPPAGTHSILLQVQQFDNPQRSAVTLLLVRVEAAQVNTPPYFLQTTYNISVLGNTPVGIPFLTVVALDEEGAVVTYKVLPTIISLIQLNPVSGQIALAQPLNYENQPEVVFEVTASDGQLEATCTVHISVIAANLHNPVFSSPIYTFDVAKAENGAIIGQVQATDEDSTSVLSYRFLDTPRQFTLNHESGHIFLVDVNGLQNSYQLVVQVTDSDSSDARTATAVVFINFENITTEAPQTPQAVSEGTEDHTNQIIIIILAVVICFLILMIVILLVCFCRSKSVPPVLRKAEIIRSTSFEEGRARHLKDYRPSSLISSDTKSSTRESRPENVHDVSRDLDMYNSVDINVVYDPDSTTMQENPFQPSPTPSPPAASKPPSGVHIWRKEIHPSSTTSMSDVGSLVVESANNVYILPARQSGYPANGMTSSNPGSDVFVASAANIPGSTELPLVGSFAGQGSDVVVPAASHQRYHTSMLEDPSVLHRNQNTYSSYPQLQRHDQSRQQYLSTPEPNLANIPPPRRFSNSPVPEEDELHESFSSDGHDMGEATSFQGGSTTRLMTEDSLDHNSQVHHNVGSGLVSFVEAGGDANSLYSSQSSQQFGLGIVDADKPGITVIY